MGVWLPSTWLAQGTLALLVSAVLASCGSAARGSILLITLPNGTAEKHLDEAASVEVWPWAASTSSDESKTPPRPAVELAPELTPIDAATDEESSEEIEKGPLSGSAAMGEGWNAWAAMATAEPSATGSLLNAVSAALAHVDGTPRVATLPAPSACDALGVFFRDKIVRGFMDPTGMIGWDRAGASMARLQAKASELHSALVDQSRWQRFFLASLEAERIALQEGEAAEQSLPMEPPIVEIAPLEAAPPVAVSVQWPSSHVRLTALARPLILKLAGALNQAGDSLESLASQLDSSDSLQSTDAAQSVDAPQATIDKAAPATDHSIIKSNNDATAPPQDPAADDFFES